MAVVCGDFHKAVEDSSSTYCIKTGPCGSGWGEETDSCPTGYKRTIIKDRSHLTFYNRKLSMVFSNAK